MLGSVPGKSNGVMGAHFPQVSRNLQHVNDHKQEHISQSNHLVSVQVFYDAPGIC